MRKLPAPQLVTLVPLSRIRPRSRAQTQSPRYSVQWIPDTYTEILGVLGIQRQRLTVWTTSISVLQISLENGEKIRSDPGGATFAPANVHAVTDVRRQPQHRLDTRQTPRQQSGAAVRGLNRSPRIADPHSHDCYVSSRLLCLTKARFSRTLSFTWATQRAPCQLSATPAWSSTAAFSQLASVDRSPCQKDLTTSSSLPSDTTKRCCFPPNGIRLVTMTNVHRTFSSRILWTG